MSCQQVSKPLVDDPYIFTETTIASPPFKKLKSSNASYLNSQVNKLPTVNFRISQEPKLFQINKITPYISSPIPANEIKLSTSLPQHNISGKITHLNNTTTYQRKNGNSVAVSTLKKLHTTTPPSKIQKQVLNGNTSLKTPQSKFGLNNCIKPVLKPTHPVQFQTAKLIPSINKTHASSPNVPKSTTILQSLASHQKSFSTPIPAKIIVSPPKHNTLSSTLACEQIDPPKLPTKEKVVFLAPAKREYSTTSISAPVVNVAPLKRKSSIPKDFDFVDKRTEQASSNEATNKIAHASRAVGLTRSNWQSPASHFLDCASSKNSLCAQTELEEERQNMLINAENFLLVQSHWLGIDDIPSTATNISREQRIELRKAQLRRQANQLLNARSFQTPHNSRKRLVYISKIINQLKTER